MRDTGIAGITADNFYRSTQLTDGNTRRDVRHWAQHTGSVYGIGGAETVAVNRSRMHARNADARRCAFARVALAVTLLAVVALCALVFA